MIEFADNHNAYAAWWMALEDANRALEALNQVYDNAQWEKAPDTFVHLLSVAVWRQTTRREALALQSRFLEQLVARPTLGDVGFRVVPGLFTRHCPLSADEAGLVARWVERVAEPNDAAMIASAVHDAVSLQGEETARGCRSLIEWLFARGSSELRSPRRATLCVELLVCVVRNDWGDLLQPAIRFLLYAQPPLDHYFSDEQGVSILAKAIERHLAEGGAVAILGDLGDALDSSARHLFLVEVLRFHQSFPLSRRELIRRLAKGAFAVPKPERAWAWAFAGPPEHFEPCDVDVARQAMDGLIALAKAKYDARALQGSVPVRHDEESQWAQLVVAQLLRAADVLESPREEDLRRLERMLYGDTFDSKFLQGLYRAVLDGVSDRKDARSTAIQQVLAAEGVRPEVVGAAFHLLRGPAPEPSPPASGDADDVAALGRVVEELLRRGAAPLGGFDLAQTTRGAIRVAFDDLQGERAFEVRDNVLILPRSVANDIATRFGDDLERDAAMVVHCLHELIHDMQGIAEKPDVNRVRFAGAESALMHIDLGADHLAALLAKRAFGWDLLWLKDLQARSVLAFPASSRHPQFSRIRKALRLVGLRADRMMRDHNLGALETKPESYGFADFGPGGGQIIFLVNGPPFTAVHIAELSKADASALFDSVDGSEGSVERVDRVLEGALGIAH